MQIVKRIVKRMFNFSSRTSWDICEKYIKIHPTVIIAPPASINIFNPQNTKDICLEIGEYSHIFSAFSLLRSQAKIKIGKRCQLGNSNFICADSIEVGDDVVMAWSVTIIDSDNHSLYWEDRKNDVMQCRKDYIDTMGKDLARSHNWRKVKIEKVKIEDKCWIGLGVIILKGVTIGEGAVIGAGSVVIRDIRPWHLAVGNPCKEIRKLYKEKKSEEL